MWEDYDLLLRAVVRIPVTLVGNNKQRAHRSFVLGKNYPNPFNSSTSWKIDLNTSEMIRAEIYDVRGRKIKELWNGPMSPGHHVMHWDGRNRFEIHVPSGIYLLSVWAGNNKMVRKLNLVR
ncbi:T9SS type A sorting domain-containing protein [candidate division KSB1 bacterium]|nr:T9SS type A sorting domain-containing protein [candidate division KSB1 bacterium]